MEEKHTQNKPKEDGRRGKKTGMSKENNVTLIEHKRTEGRKRKRKTYIKHSSK